MVHLGDYIYEGRVRPATVRAARRAPCGSLERLPRPLRAIQDRSAPAGRARRVPVAGDLGRPRGRERLRRLSRARDASDDRRGAARPRVQAFWEHMPLAARAAARPRLRCIGRCRWGALARSTCSTPASTVARIAAPARARDDARLPELADPARPDLGAGQEAWLLEGPRTHGTDWNVLANQVRRSHRTTPTPIRLRSALSAARSGMANSARPAERSSICWPRRNLVNTVVITGDVHVNYVRNIPPDHIRLPRRRAGRNRVHRYVDQQRGRHPVRDVVRRRRRRIPTSSSPTGIVATSTWRSRRTYGATSSASSTRSRRRSRPRAIRSRRSPSPTGSRAHALV